MAAVRCAARRLGGSLLQRTQAAVAEEGRRLVPSRFMRSRQLSSEVSSEHVGKIPKKQELSESQQRLSDLLDQLEEHQKKAVPDVFQLRLKSVGRATQDVVHGAAKLTFFCMITAAVAFGGEGVEAQAVTKENQ